jgi:hypothetical protein
MKYLKKFNEELDSNTYMRASRKLDKLGHIDRASNLKNWSNEIERRGELTKWQSRLKEYSPFGIYKINIVNPSSDKKIIEDFALDVNFDADSFEDNFEWMKESDQNLQSSIILFIGLIPTSEEVLKKCEGVMPQAEFGNGMFWGLTCAIEFEIVNEQVVIKEFNIDDYDEGLSGHVSFANRTSANKFKTLLKNIFTKPDLNYPSGYTDADSIYQKLEQTISIRQSFSSDYGFELKSVADFINTISPNEMYKTIQW